MTDTVDVTINKPVYGNFVYIRDKYIKQAIKQGKQLKITIPQGTALADPNEWVKTGKRLEKEFLIPGRPMTMWGNYVRIKEED